MTIDRRTMGLGAALGLAGCATGATVQVHLAGQQPPPPVADDTQVGTGVDYALRMTAPVRINGQGPFDFVVDTGANRTVLSTELAAALNLPSRGVADVHGVSGVEPAPLVAVDLLEVDAVATRRITAPTLPRGRLGIDGLLGVDVLKNRRVVMDFTRNRLTIGAARAPGPERSGYEMRRGAGGAEIPGARVVVPARYRFGQLVIIGADVAGRPVTAFVDSGSQSTVGNGALRRIVLGAPNRAPQAVMYRVPILSATGQTSQGEMGTMPLLQIGGMRIQGLMAVFADLHVFDIWDLTERPSLLLGMDVMRQFNAIELNYARRELVFYLKREARRIPRG